jgi:hypothetical protein
MKKTYEQPKVELEVDTGIVDLFKIDSSQIQGSSNLPPSLPAPCQHKRSRRSNDYHQAFNDKNVNDDNEGSKGGKQGKKYK